MFIEVNEEVFINTNNIVSIGLIEPYNGIFKWIFYMIDGSQKYSKQFRSIEEAYNWLYLTFDIKQNTNKKIDRKQLEEKVRDLFYENYNAYAELYNELNEELGEEAVMTEERFVEVVANFILNNFKPIKLPL